MGRACEILQPPNNVPGPLLHTQGVTGVSAQAGMCFLWILLPQGATLWAQHRVTHSSFEPCVSPSNGTGIAVGVTEGCKTPLYP